MTHIVQFTTLPHFLADLTAGETVAIYHDLIEQRTATTGYGGSRWLLTTIIRAIVANGRVTHLATLTIPHGPQVDRLAGRIFGPPSAEALEPARWDNARREHDLIINHLGWQLNRNGLNNLARPGILNAPTDLPLVLAAHPLNKRSDGEDDIEARWAALLQAADAAADSHPGGDGSPG